MEAANRAGARTRRRGPRLEQALYQAALEELTAAGYAGLTMEGVARRAQTGKAALYRRWASKADLVLDALRHALPDPREISLSGSVRDNLVAALTVMADTLAGRVSGPGLDVLAELLHEPELRRAFHARVIEPRLQLLHGILAEAAERGEIDPAAVTPLAARTGPALVIQAFLFTGAPPLPGELAQIVDTVLIPLLTPR